MEKIAVCIEMARKCPPGVFCVTPGVIFVGLFLLFALGFWLRGGGVSSAASASAAPPMPSPVPDSRPLAIQIATSQEGGDDRYTRAPKPERQWITRPDIPNAEEIYGKLPRVPTRGLPESYQNMGVLTMDDGSVLPLYGRRTAARSDRFQYYTRTDTYNPVQLPLNYKRRDCQDDVGCDELFSGESLTVSATGQKGKVTMYRFDGPTYVPGIL